MRRFQDGGETEFESKQGENPGISDDIRARAMKYVREQNEPSSELVKEPPVAKTKAVKKEFKFWQIVKADYDKEFAQSEAQANQYKFIINLI